ncbi:unnamed protein product [Macrosiphum euphorbiae]|uniref:Uncharacterized protein n=1 Tax=Macrosiphum euphorbiae TaxID=13131 RepID=A0AAV0VK97_9HEMI|nr:unnamed protein product [Macrosiphum euphorbiae]
MTMTTVITGEKSKRSNVNGFEGKREKRKSLIKVTGHDDRPVEAAKVKSTGPKHINGKAGDKGRSSSTICGTRRSVATITPVGDQTADPNLKMTPLVPFTPRTRTQPRLTSTDSKTCTTKKWKCDEDIEDEPATDPSNSIGTVWQDFTLPTRLPKYQTPIDPVTKLFLKMTSKDRWRRRPADKCTKPY